MDNLEHLRFPIGRFQAPEDTGASEIESWILTISNFPYQVREVLNSLDKEQLLTPYRKNGWNGAQVVHHCADSHLNAYIRFKLGLTEDSPEIRPYLENKWAELKDANSIDLTSSLSILEGLHNRWTIMLKNMTSQEFERKVIHPEHGRQFTLGQLLAMYTWHCNHHLAHLNIIQTSFE